MPQNYGGAWTEKKLQTLERYAELYIKSVGKRFKVHYIDAFAGDGEGSSKEVEILDDQPEFFPTSNRIIIEGSASRLTNLQFHSLHFVEKNPDHVEKLSSLINKKGIQNGHVHHGDANTKILEILKTISHRDRVLLFLDPFGLQVKWETLEAIAKQGVMCDIWYLFPFQRINSSISNSDKTITPHMKTPLKRCLGLSSEEIEKSIFDISGEVDLFGQVEPEKRKERGVEQLFIKRLTKEFEYVEENPICLTNTQGRHIFSFILCSNNPSEKAKNLIKRFAKHVKGKL